jgi:hypothetical protein
MFLMKYESLFTGNEKIARNNTLGKVTTENFPGAFYQ